MKITRRRFLTITAAMSTAPSWVTAESWQGRAFGADVSLTIRGPRIDAAEAIAQTRQILRDIERLFSIYDPGSAVSQLNAAGVIFAPDSRFVELMRKADQAHRLTAGLFDPTIQPLWRALAEGKNVDTAKSAIGWDRVQFNARAVSLGEGQALTFNGIAQGFATDMITRKLIDMGLTNALVNIGEYRAVGGPWQLAIADPAHGVLGQRKITDGAIATSSPTALSLGDQSHILHPKGRVQWSTVSVEASTATLADCLSTALCLASYDQIAELRKTDGVNRITLIDLRGNLTTL